MPKVETSSTNTRGTSQRTTINQITNVSIGSTNKQVGTHNKPHHRIHRQVTSTNSSQLNHNKRRRVVKKLLHKRLLSDNTNFHHDESNIEPGVTSVRPHRRRVIVTKRRRIDPTTVADQSEARTNKRSNTRRRVVVTKKRLIQPTTFTSDYLQKTADVQVDHDKDNVIGAEKDVTPHDSKSSNKEEVVSSSVEILFDEDSFILPSESDKTETPVTLTDFFILPQSDNDEDDYESDYFQPELDVTTPSDTPVTLTDFFILPPDESENETSSSSVASTQDTSTMIIPTRTTTLTNIVYETKTTETTRLRTYTFIITRVNGAEQIVTSTTEVKPQLKTLTITEAHTLTTIVTVTDLQTTSTLPPMPMTSIASSGESLHDIHTKEYDGRRFNFEEARYNLATRVMSNGVEVIVAGDKTTYPGDPNIRRILSTTNTKPITLAPSTLTDHMMMALPQHASEVAHLSSSLYQNQFVTKTCLTTYTYLTTYLENGSTTVSSHEQVVKNIATEERNSAKIVATPTSTAGITLTQNPNLATGIFHTTYTYLYTIMDEDQPLVITSKHTVANTVTAPDDYLSLLQPSEMATPVHDTNTYLSTIALTKTLTEGSAQKVVSTKDVVTQVVITESLPPKGTSVMTSYFALDVDDISPTATRDYTTTDVIKTYFVTYTYYNTFLEDGKTVVRTNISTSSDVVTEKLYLHPKRTQTATSTKSDVIVTTPISDYVKMQQPNSELPLDIYATKTYLTTYTYFTTYLPDTAQNNAKSPVVSSSTKIVENLVTEKLEPSLLDHNFLNALQKSADKSGKGFITTATLTGGEELEVTVVNKYKIQPTKSVNIISETSTIRGTTMKTTEHLEASSPSVITGSTIVFFDDDPFQNLITPTLTVKPTKINKSTIKNELGSLLSSEIVHQDQSVAEASQHYVTSILGSRTIISTGATLNPGDKVIVLKDQKGNATLIPLSDPNKKKIANKHGKPANVQVPNLLNLGSLGINSLTALGPVFNAMAGLIQTNLHGNRRQDNTTTSTTTTTITPYHKAVPTAKPPPSDQNRSPIYIPVANFADEGLELAESQNIAAYDLNLPPRLRPDPAWANDISKYKSQVVIGKPTHESPLVNGGIPISPGQVITANSDVIVGKPAILGPRLPPFTKTKGPILEADIPIGMKPPPPPAPPKRIWPKKPIENSYKEHNLNLPNKVQNFGSMLNVPAIPLQDYTEETIENRQPVYDAVPQFSRIEIGANHDNYNPLKHPSNKWNTPNEHLIQPTKVPKDNPTLVFAKPVKDINIKPPVGDPISLPEVIERSTGQPLLVNIQPSQVANVIIPHGSTTALIFGGASEPHKNGQYFDDPSPYPEQENTPAFPTGDRIQNNVPQITSIYNAFPNVVNQKPVSGMINVESQKVKYGVDINAPPLTFSVTNNGMKQNHLTKPSTGVVNLDSHIINHDISVHVPPISFGMINSGNDFTAHIISHDPKFNPPIVHNVVSKEPPKVTVPYFTSGDNRPVSFNKQKIPTFTYSETGDMNINVSPQPLPDLSAKDHVAPNGIVLDGANDMKPPNTDYTNTRPYNQQQGTSYLEHLTPPPPPEVHPRPRPVSYAPKINPLQFMTPPPISIPHIKMETYPKPLTIPLNYDTVSLQKYGKNSTVVTDYSNEEYSDDSKEDVNEHGEAIQESKTRPLRPGQIPHEILKMNSSSTTTRRPYTHNYKNTYPYLHPVKVNTDYPRPFRPAVHETAHKSTTLQRNKTEHRVTIPIKERPHFISPKPNVHEPHRTTSGLKVSRPHFSTSMPIQTNEPHFPTGNIQNIFNLNQYRPTSMPVDPKEEEAPSSPKPINRFGHTHHSGTQTEKPFSGNYTSNNEGVNGSTIQTFSFSNKDIVTTEVSLTTKVFPVNTNKQTRITGKISNVLRVTVPPHTTKTVSPSDMYFTKSKPNVYSNNSLEKSDVDVKLMETLMPPKLNSSNMQNIPDVHMKPPKSQVPLGSHPVPNFVEKPINTQRPFVQTPSEEMKPPPEVMKLPPEIQYKIPSNDEVMGLSPPPLMTANNRPVTTSPKTIPPVTVQISTYRPVFTTTKQVPPYMFELPQATESPTEIVTKNPVISTRKPTRPATRIYSRYTTTTFKPISSITTTARPVYRLTRPIKVMTTKNATTITNPTTQFTSTTTERVIQNVTSSTITPTTVRKTVVPSIEVIIGHPTLNAEIPSTTERKQPELDTSASENAQEVKPNTTTTTQNQPPLLQEPTHENTHPKDIIQPTSVRPEMFSTGIHHAGNEIKIVDDTPSLIKPSKVPTTVKETKTILPTKYITHTHTLTVTTTKTTVVKSLGSPPSTLTLLVTRTQTSTVVDTVTQTHTLVQPTSIVETVTTTVSHTPIKPDNVQEGTYETSTYPSFPVQATAMLHPNVVPTITYENISDLNEFIITDTEPPTSPEEELEPVNKHEENDSIFVVMTDKKPGVFKIPKDFGETENVNVGDYTPPHRDEVLSSNEVNRVLLGGILIASPPSLESPDIVPPGVSNECRPDCKASRNELCQRVDRVMRCVCRPGFARMFPDRPCKPTYTYRMKINLARHGKEMLRYQQALAEPTSPEYTSLASATHEALDRMVMQSDLRDIYHGVQVNGFEPGPKDSGIINNFYVQLSDNTDETRLKEIFKKYLRGSNYSLGGTEIYAAKELLDDLDAMDFDECTNVKFHDCSEHAQCFNLRGTYTCSCKEGFADLSENPLYPGRICSAELIGCERCHYHGTCYSRGDEQVLCECFQWYAGESCHINLKVLLIALVTMGAILFTLLLVCVVLTCVKRGKPESAGVASGMSFLPHRPVVGGRRSGTLDRRAMIQDTSSEGSDTLPYVPKKPKKLKGALKKPTNIESEIETPNSTFGEQRDRSLTVMIPRAKYHPPPPTSPLLNITSFDKRKNSVPSSNEAKLLSYLDAGPTPNKENVRRKISNTPSDSCLMKSSRKISSGALVSAGFEVSATVGAKNMGTLGTIATTCGTEADRSENATLIQKISADVLSSSGTQSQFTTLRKSVRNDDENDAVDNWLDITPRVMTVSEARSYDETTVQMPTKSLRSGYDSKPSSHHHNNDEANTMAERDMGSTFLLPHTHLYKPDRGSDISGFDSL